MPPYVVPIDVRFSDLDALGHVNSTKVFQFAEHARVNWLLGEGGAPAADRLPVIVAAASADYKAPIPKEAALDVVMRTGRIGTKSWDFEYELRDRRAGILYAIVKTVQVSYDYAAAQSRPIPGALRAQLERLTQ